jgi:hypothetical protein
MNPNLQSQNFQIEHLQKPIPSVGGGLGPVPAEVATAIVKVMSGIRTLARDNSNSFGNYNFASTDTFLAALNPLCADAGLAIIQIEEDFSVEVREMEDEKTRQIKRKSYLTMRFGFILAHISGATWGPVRRSIIVPAAGPQAFGTAQSYAIKQYMRSLFQVPTGERDDADFQQAEELPKRDDAFARAHAANIRASLDLCETAGEVLAVMNDNRELLNNLADGETIRQEARTQYKKLEAKKKPVEAWSLAEDQPEHSEQEAAQ